MIGQLLMFNCEQGKAIACHSYDDEITYDVFLND